MKFALWSSHNHTPIKYRGPIKENSCITPAYLSSYQHFLHFSPLKREKQSHTIASTLVKNNVHLQANLESRFLLSQKTHYVYACMQHCVGMLGKGTSWWRVTRMAQFFMQLCYPPPGKSEWGTCMLQSWVLGFNPNNLSMLTFPTWVSLRSLS